MGVREESSKRRKSIAGTSSRSSLGNKGRRRAYSIAPGSALSPLAKARRDLVSDAFNSVDRVLIIRKVPYRHIG